jgi:hypothetical protein
MSESLAAANGMGAVKSGAARSRVSDLDHGLGLCYFFKNIKRLHFFGADLSEWVIVDEMRGWCFHDEKRWIFG